MKTLLLLLFAASLYGQHYDLHFGVYTDGQVYLESVVRLQDEMPIQIGRGIRVLIYSEQEGMMYDYYTSPNKNLRFFDFPFEEEEDYYDGEFIISIPADPDAETVILKFEGVRQGPSTLLYSYDYLKNRSY